MDSVFTITLTTAELFYVSSAVNTILNVYGSSDVGDVVSAKFDQCLDKVLAHNVVKVDVET